MVNALSRLIAPSTSFSSKPLGQGAKVRQSDLPSTSRHHMVTSELAFAAWLTSLQLSIAAKRRILAFISVRDP